MEDVTITPLVISTVAGSLLSLVLFVLEIFWPQFDNMPANKKQGINLLLILVVGVGIGSLSCWTDIVFVECSQVGLANLISNVFFAMIGNASTYKTVNHVADATKEEVR